MSEPTAPTPGTIIVYYDGQGSGFLLVDDSHTREAIGEGMGSKWTTVIDVDGWAFRRGHDGTRWVTAVPHVSDPNIAVGNEPYWRLPTE